MIVLDTHIWVWWVDVNPLLPEEYRIYIQAQEAHGLGVSIISRVGKWRN
jgi:PIN domain nuclease of toxin-antitoxin system